MTRALRPSLADLLHLVDRAASRRLIPGEADLLRDALRRAENGRRSAAGARAELDRTKRELRAAEDELQVRRKAAAERAVLAPIQVACPFCGAEPASRCRNALGSTRIHQTRITAARESR